MSDCQRFKALCPCHFVTEFNVTTSRDGICERIIIVIVIIAAAAAHAVIS
jgi:hypothetical protein